MTAHTGNTNRQHTFTFPEGSGNLVLVRHGETASNTRHILDTRLPGPPLTAKGAEQARNLAARLARPAALVASQAQRAQETAGFLASAAGLAVQVTAGIHEVQVGDWEGRADREAHQKFEAVFHAWHAGDLEPRPPGGESGRDVLDRFLPVIAQLREQYLQPAAGEAELASKDVVVVSHGAAIRLVAASLTAIPGEFSANSHLDNTGSIVLRPLPGGGWQCLRWGIHTPPFVATATVPDDPMG